jgi:hypothetical protein
VSQRHGRVFRTLISQLVAASSFFPFGAFDANSWASVLIFLKHTTPSQTRKTNWRRSLVRSLFLVAAPIILGFGGPWPANAAAANTSALDRSEGTPPNVGSINEYMDNSGNLVLASYLPLIGIHVFEGCGKLASGQQFSGLSVTSVDRPGPGDDAGIRAAHVRVLRVATEMGLGVMVVGATLFFPPAILGIPLIQKMDSPKAYDVIVAVDAARTRSISELENSLRNVKAGETIYLTIIRDGRREQLRVLARPIFDPHAPTSQSMLPE